MTKALPILIISVILLAGCSGTPADTSSTTAPAAAADTSVFTESKTTQYFTSDAIPEVDVKTILTAGTNAQSAMNSQPWHFTAVSNTAMLADLKAAVSANMPDEMKNNPNAKAMLGDSPLAIVVSSVSGNEFDAGLACQNMLNTAQTLGYGAKIVSSPAAVLNSDYRSELFIPNDMSVTAVLLIGKPDDSIDTTADGVTSASVREDFQDVCSIIK